VLGKLVNQEGITLLMATLGITYFLDGFGQTLFGSTSTRSTSACPRTRSSCSRRSSRAASWSARKTWYAAVIAAALVAALALFFQYTSTGRALRAVADDHQAAQSIGIPLKRIWVIVWSVAGFVALVAGIIWGSKLGVQFSLAWWR
jgi:branched-chain amino acid transport system permease protein